MAKEKLPYLNCPFCPSQALPCDGQCRPYLIRYKCATKHYFYIVEPEKETNENSEHCAC